MDVNNRDVAGDAPTLSERLAVLRQLCRERDDSTLQQRLTLLQSLAHLLVDHQAALAEAVSADFGHRSEVETRVLELFPTLEAIRHARHHLPRWMKRQRRGVAFWFWPGQAWVEPQPLGVVGIVVPWNYPLYLALGPLVSALAAGNRVMIKMSEFTPRTGQLLASLLERYLGSKWVQTVNGGVDVARAFSALPFDHLLFTGSTEVGRQVMKGAADHLVPVTLELGGKSPVIVAPGFLPARAAAAIVAGKLLNAGQTCVAPDYVLVPAGERQALLDAIENEAVRRYPHWVDNPDYTTIINPDQLQRLEGLLDDAKAKGAQIRQVNPPSEDWRIRRAFPLTLVWNCPPEAALLQQEIFGPILPLIEYDSIEAAIAYVNQRPHPLALYLFDDNAQRVRSVLRQTRSGGVTVNETMLHVAQGDLPFGGVGHSGMGHYHGREGFQAFSKLRPVFRQGRPNAIAWMRPPYGSRARWLLKLMLRR
nr:coniferyl aldehyde dehydrogenase [uncultured Pseudogulbenkiania sp.]